MYSSYPVVYRDGTVYDLTSLLAPGGGCTATSAVSINNAGQIAGYANCNGGVSAVVFTPQ